MKQNTALILLLFIGTIGITGIWKIRHESGYQIGVTDGFYNGNITGYAQGLDTGTEAGYIAGYDAGVDLGKDFGRLEGFSIGFDSGTLEGEIDGYSDGYAEGEAIGLPTGYYSGLEYGSKTSTLRDPTNEEALQFIEIDDTDEIFRLNPSLSSSYLLTRIRQNAAAKGFRCIWVQVEMFGQDQYFCAFNTTDLGILYFNYRHDLIHEIEIGKHCYDERYTEPAYDDTVTKIIFIS